MSYAKGKIFNLVFLPLRYSAGDTYRGSGLVFFISCRALAREGDYKMHHVCACVCALVCHADFSQTTTARDFLSIVQMIFMPLKILLVLLT